MAKRLKDIIIHLDYEDEYKDGKVEVNIIASEPEELIMCKDCAFGRTGENVGVGKWNIDCLNPNISKYRLPTDYCSYGKKRDDGKLDR